MDALVFKYIDAVISERAYTQIIAMVGGTICGVVKLSHRGKRAAYIQDLFVSPEIRRMRVGSRLVNLSCDMAKESRCYSITALMQEEADILSDFYLSLGFVFGYEYDNGDILMIRVL